MTNSFPYGNDLADVNEWIGQYGSKSNNWHIQFLGGGNTVTDCELHFLLHGLDSLTTAYAVLKGSGLGLPFGPKGLSYPRNVRELSDSMSENTLNQSNQSMDNFLVEQSTLFEFTDRVSQSSVWNDCYNLNNEKQFLTRRSRYPFSLEDLDGSSSSVEIVSTSLVIVEMISVSFRLPGDEENGFTPLEMGSVDTGLSMPGTSAGTFGCRWDIKSWKNNFYGRCPFRKGGQMSRFTDNRFLHHLPPYTGYLFQTRDDYQQVFPDESYPFWQDLFPQLNESVAHFVDPSWAGPVVGGWHQRLPASYIREFG